MPEAIEIINYQITAFRHQGRLLVGFGASKNHCDFFLMITSVLNVFKGDLKDYEIGKGSIRFQADKPLPSWLAKKLFRARIAENLALSKKK